VLKKTITYNDLDGNPVTEDFWFHLSKAELAEMEMSTGNGMTEKLKRIIESKDNATIIQMFKEIITSSYGRRSEDGRSFIKKSEWTAHFIGTEAFSELFVELMTDGVANVEFIKGIVPPDLATNIKDPIAPSSDNNADPAERTVDQYSRDELLALSDEEFDKLAGTEPLKMSPAVLMIAYQRKSQSKV
jgi:hypothetical protein